MPVCHLPDQPRLFGPARQGEGYSVPASPAASATKYRADTSPLGFRFAHGLLALALTLSSQPAVAQFVGDPHRAYSQTFRQCLVGAREMGVDQAACYQSELEIQDGRLNQAYVMIMRRQGQPRRQALRAKQREWITYRDAKCSPPASKYRTGEAPPLRSLQCLLDETVSRRLYLESLR